MIRLDRLQILHDYLRDRVRPDRFDLRVWFNYLRSELHPEPWVGGCGTTACAVGYATEIPEFQDEGFRMDRNRMMPKFKDQYEWFAVQSFFGLNPAQAYYLFALEFNEQLEWIERNTIPATCTRISEFIQRHS